MYALPNKHKNTSMYFRDTSTRGKHAKTINVLPSKNRCYMKVNMLTKVNMENKWWELGSTHYLEVINCAQSACTDH